MFRVPNSWRFYAQIHFPNEIGYGSCSSLFQFSLKCNWCSVWIWKINSTEVIFLLKRWNCVMENCKATESKQFMNWIDLCSYIFQCISKGRRKQTMECSCKQRVSVRLREGKRLYELLVWRISLNWLACNASTKTRCLSSTLVLCSPKIHWILTYLVNQNDEFGCIWNNLTMFTTKQLQF